MKTNRNSNVAFLVGELSAIICSVNGFACPSSV